MCRCLINKTHNHIGVGVRNDERPYAHLIPPGGNWRNLSVEDQRSFMMGAFESEGGRSYCLRRMDWGEPAATLTTTMSGKATCQIHPGYDFEGRGNYAPYDITPQLPPNGLTCVELFAGGGLMAVGLKTAGYDILWANDIDKDACTAYAMNIGDHILQGDLTEMGKIIPDSIPEADILAGSPPCQDYSSVGRGAGEAGEKGRLVWSYLDIIQAKQPKAFLFENVMGLVSEDHRPTFDALLKEFANIGYNVSWNVCCALDHGVAQKRDRVFIIGVRSDIGFWFSFPFPEIGRPTPCLKDAIGDLPDPEGLPHPRKYTVRECLRIQSVPDWYRFPDSMSMASMYRIVGNGVASKVAYDLGKELAMQLNPWACE